VEELSHTIFIQTIPLIMSLNMGAVMGAHIYAARRRWAWRGKQAGTKKNRYAVVPITTSCNQCI
jgi:hypothetical protein